MCKSKHHGFGALRALVDFFFCSGPGGSVVEVLGFAHISFFGTMWVNKCRTRPHYQLTPYRASRPHYQAFRPHALILTFVSTIPLRYECSTQSDLDPRRNHDISFYKTYLLTHVVPKKEMCANPSTSTTEPPGPLQKKKSTRAHAHISWGQFVDNGVVFYTY